MAQTTIATGSIQGSVIDPSIAVIPNASVTISNNSTGQVIGLTSSSAGIFSSGALLPGNYLVRVKAIGFKALEIPVIVQVGVTTPANVQLTIGRKEEIIQVKSSDVRVNSEQAIVQGVMTEQQIQNLPINGRNFLDLAQLEPGVQIQDGSNFDPTKTGLSSISFGGRFGRAARIEVDGVDVSDETVGTTTQNIPASGIQEFQLSQSSLDLSNELTSSGAVNVVTRSGTNTYHGEAFNFFRDSSVAAALPGPPAPFQRHQFGGRFGGPLKHDKVFFFADAERTKQDLFAPIPLPNPFSQLSGSFNAPFRETETLGRLDWQARSSVLLFYRFSYYQALAAAGTLGFQPYNSKNYTKVHAVGADFSTGEFTHSVRFGYLNFQNNIEDAVRGTSLPFANFPISINIGPLATGPSLLAPQATRQSNYQFKYDGSKVIGPHIIRYGVAHNRIMGGGFDKFFSITPTVFTNLGTFEEDFADNSCGPGNPCFHGGRHDPRNYPVELVIVGNGQGFLAEKPAFGYPSGGFGPNHRLGLYLGDTWKIRPNFNVTYGVRYVRDTSRSDSDLPPLPSLNSISPGFGHRVRQPNINFAPQAGIAWGPGRNGKTVLRAGAGIFYENVLWGIGLLGDRSYRLPRGAFISARSPCIAPGVAAPVPFADGSVQFPPPGSCGDAAGDPIAIGLAVPQLSAFQNSFQSVAASVGTNAANPNYLPTLIANGLPIPDAFAPDFQTPRSVQMNVGIERELRRGTVISADYLRNVALHFFMSLDANHTGDSRFLNADAAKASIDTTLTQCGVNSVAAGTAPNNCPGNGAPSGISGRSLSIADFAANGLDSPEDLGGGACGTTLGFSCAFAGMKPRVGSASFLFPIGRSVYNALQLKLLHELNDPVRGIRQLHLQVSYALSRFVNPGAGTTPINSDQDGGIGALDKRGPLRFTGPSTLDRTHQLSFGGIAELPHSLQVSFIAHFDTALPATLFVPSTNLGPGEIFRTDFTGDGTVGDILPGTNTGSFGRDVSTSNLNRVIVNYNNRVAETLTPAGEALVQAGLFTKAQLLALGAVAPEIPLAPKGQVGLDALRSFDMRISWGYKFRDRFTIEPSAAAFNLFNFANFDLPGSVLSGLLTGASGTANGTMYQDRVANRVGAGTGVFALGAPRAFEFGLRITF
jgi:carboxypeptidase family protein